MTNAIKFIPEGYHTATPYLVITNAAKAIEFYKQAFGATELMRLEGPGDKIVHAEIRIGDSSIILADEYPDFNALSPQTIGGSAVSIMLYVEDVDTVVDRAVAAGASLIMPVKDQFYGDRSGKIIDPFGHHWMIATHKEDVSPEEIRQRADALFGMF
ncbi:MAG: VOC family protein [Methylobacter sp.]